MEAALRWLLALWWPLGQFSVALVALLLGVVAVRRLRRRRAHRWAAQPG